MADTLKFIGGKQLRCQRQQNVVGQRQSAPLCLDKAQCGTQHFDCTAALLAAFDIAKIGNKSKQKISSVMVIACQPPQQTGIHANL